jgi:hypothetical protein
LISISPERVIFPARTFHCLVNGEKVNKRDEKKVWLDFIKKLLPKVGELLEAVLFKNKILEWND